MLPMLAQHVPQNDKNPLAGNGEAAAAGHKLYDQTCLGCHGADGRGGERAPSLAGTLKHGSSEGEIFQNIRGGIAGTQMPAFSQLTADQGWRLVTLHTQPFAGGGSQDGGCKRRRGGGWRLFSMARPGVRVVTRFMARAHLWGRIFPTPLRTHQRRCERRFSSQTAPFQS